MNEYTYEVINVTNSITGNVTQVIMRSDGALIPEDPANSDYQAYLAWLENPNAEITPPVL
jgi:hypothetical protein